MAQEIADSTLLDTWASSGLIVEPDISKIIEGWQLGEQPPHEYMNWLQNTFGSKLNHILKNGVASWNNTTQYLAGSSVQHNGNVWLCKTTNTNSEPTDANANWKRIITVESLTTVLGEYVSLTGDQTISGIKTFIDRPFFLSPNNGTTGAVGLIDAEGNPDAVYIQALNNEQNTQYGYLKINKNGTITPSGSIVGNITGNAETVTNGVYTTNFTGINQSLAINGYQKLPGGLIMQWGLVTNNIGAGSTAYVNYNIAFPAGVCYTAIQVQSVAVNDEISTPFIILPGDGTGLARFQIYNTDIDSALSIYRWFSIGY